ncbi:DUF1801 domain-containing protein [Methanocella arvoryzae]|uniref:YdhG-like domain-containing protein n=1 Tax=Methanocella arvoryzae (strain DSM 22066 / NBRC 105507 / MRE50) TaxID=351160 RepID=Q0W655_METAR|nr:DUF1801 domain-containing protein [Methanocella arvoryzae]CAJ36138.1 conserved hypothetical protein [Methanocella arvoryzae MRE50]
MAELKTRKTEASVTDFLNGIADERKRQESFTLLELMREATGQEPKMWGANIVGFGDVHLRYETGRELDWFPVGFSPRKQNLTVYINKGLTDYQPLLGRLGKYRTGKSCLYINKLADVDTGVLKEIIRQASMAGIFYSQ